MINPDGSKERIYFMKRKRNPVETKSSITWAIALEKNSLEVALLWA